jgi:hypothetical protein
VRGQQHESEETRREETHGVEAQVGIAEIEEDGTFRPEQVCRGTEDHAREEVAPFGQEGGDQKDR